MDRSLATFLRTLQTAEQHGDASKLLPTATSLLFSLSNPLNLTLLASQLLIAPALWDRVRNVQDCRRIFSVFYTAASQIGIQGQARHLQPNFDGHQSISREAWVTAVVKGADERTPRWRHLVLLGGLLIGFDREKKSSIPHNLRTNLELALVTATNLALGEHIGQNDIGQRCLVFVLNSTFALLADHHQARIEYNLLLPVIIDVSFFSSDGLEHGWWLGTIGEDLLTGTEKKLRWPIESGTFSKVQQIENRPLVQGLGPLARLIAHSIENATNAGLVMEAIDRLADFARTLNISWRRNKLSEIDVSEEPQHLEAESLQKTIPVLWRSFFASVIVLRASLGRLLIDRFLSSDANAPLLGMQALHILRNFHFTSHRLGQTSSSQYTYVHLTAIDVLTQYPDQAGKFLTSVRPLVIGHVSKHPAERNLDLFFLNTAEHFTLTLKPQLNQDLLLAAALPYLGVDGNGYMLDMLEAGHSLTLAILAAPRNAEIATRQLPVYVETLLASFPARLSSRQFRLALKTVIRILDQGVPDVEPTLMLSPVLLDLIYDSAVHASTEPLPPHQRMNDPMPLTEQAVLTLAIIDCLSCLRLDILQEWLPLTAELVTKIEHPTMKQACQQRFWEVISSGEMDVNRALICVAWWTSRGGRELLLFGHDVSDNDDSHPMSGALQPEAKL